VGRVINARAGDSVSTSDRDMTVICKANTLSQIVWWNFQSRRVEMLRVARILEESRLDPLALAFGYLASGCNDASTILRGFGTVYFLRGFGWMKALTLPLGE
jgi:hypothetical protein